MGVPIMILGALAHTTSVRMAPEHVLQAQPRPKDAPSIHSGLGLVVLLYAGRWRGPDDEAQAKIVRSHVAHLIEPLRHEGNAKRRVLVVFAGTSSQWQSQSALRASQTLPTVYAERGVANSTLQAELSAAFPADYTVISSLFPESDVSSVKPALDAVDALGRNSRSGSSGSASGDGPGNTDSRLSGLESWRAQMINLRRAYKLSVEWRHKFANLHESGVGGTIFVRSRLDVMYASDVEQPWELLHGTTRTRNGESVPPRVYAEVDVSSIPIAAAKEPPKANYMDYTYVFADERCVSGLSAAGHTGRGSPPLALRRCTSPGVSARSFETTDGKHRFETHCGMLRCDGLCAEEQVGNGRATEHCDPFSSDEPPHHRPLPA